ncbi:hypothetical protein Barb6_02996 [Bacteroidales bacterium Barb6]|nr:hypothetical protein Barb6_02996 [Bacteroidales bacterium Barb6]
MHLNGGYAAVGFAMGIVKLLDAASARYVVFAHGDFELAVVGQFTRSLDESFPERARADEHGTV